MIYISNTSFIISFENMEKESHRFEFHSYGRMKKINPIKFNFTIDWYPDYFIKKLDIDQLNAWKSLFNYLVVIITEWRYVEMIRKIA